ncbi:FUSC family protein [Ancylobacter oerskovii]|uniref:FUSC family protein n=1 Tax=Ancylobacter oerskovii TaxID=459519 RepID=A0ABW4Z561_9HYPH|nr:FUSC family protein [Ancylobacter oerskovii]
MTDKAERPRSSHWRGFPVDLGWRNLAVSTRLACAAVAALAIAYWLELPQPQWAVLTVYLLTQSSAGAAFAKGTFRLLGTVIAASCAVICVKLFAQAPVPLVGTAMAWMFLCYYGATRMSNFTAYGFMLAGYTGLLVLFEGAVDPNTAWQVALDRTTETSIGIACATLANALVLPVYAGAQLRALVAGAFSRLADYAATALTSPTGIENVIRLRSDILRAVTKFDALRSYTMFEAREMRANDAVLREIAREFLTVLSIERGLYVRLTDVRGAEGDPLTARLAPVLEATSATLDAIAHNPNAFANPERLRADLAMARRRLAVFSREIEALAGEAPLAPLANTALVVRRAIKMLRGLSFVALTAQSTFRPAAPSGMARSRPRLAERREAVLQGARAALAVLALCVFWYATEWDQGIAGITGLALMSYQCVNTDDPEKLGWPYFRAVIAACFCAYAVKAFVYPWLEGFGMLATFLLLVLVPLGILIGTPRFAKTAGTFTIFFVACATTGNVYDPDPLTFANFCFGLVVGMFVCLMAARLLPVTSQASRRLAYRRTMHQLLPEAAAGPRPARRVAREIVDLIVALLPHLSSVRQEDDVFLRGMLCSASSALELGRLHQAVANPALPPAGRAALAAGLSRFAAIFTALPERAEPRREALELGRAAIGEMWTALERLDPPAGSPAARAVLHAASGLRFLLDRFELDHAFLDRSFSS